MKNKILAAFKDWETWQIKFLIGGGIAIIVYFSAVIVSIIQEFS